MLKIWNFASSQIRFKHTKVHWSKLQKKVTATKRALDHFDDFYSTVFGNRWKSIRVALLSQHKYVALVNIFGDSENTCKALELQGAINVRSLFNLAQERLKNNINEDVKNQINLDNTLAAIIKKQESKEIESMYPEDAHVNLPEKIFYKRDDIKEASYSTKDEAILEDITEFKKPLEQKIEENYQIDESRVIDFTQGSAGLHNFIPATQIKGMENWVLESDHYKYYSTNSDFPLEIQMENEINFPETLSLYTYEKGNCSTFIPPYNCETGVLSHFLMDGSSILPPLVLDIKHGDKVLDACAAPGGKSLLMLQTLYPEVLVCNDVQKSRVGRIYEVMNQYIFDFEEKWINQNRCIIQNYNALALDEYEKYDKVLVDVPCTTDRHSLAEDDNNIFKPGRIKERLKIPELQSRILANCLRLVKPGGSLVYSTCSLSPVQNDGVVHMALQNLFVEHGLTFIVKDLSLVVKCFQDIFKFENSKNLKYGQLVLPYLPANFGPMYFCKMTRI
ncbi:5-methylcytosine rRNA methyltransferase NSUN4 [Condylostylus longicornis]|uniref:5-methylcytosine rRNA methyltransferase NSUN4 n=1 Tax=Condylostylus longicornis TaxID=2530218 RepID=UPI00244E148A|nr:5-methylcytosine rRNA methyltransferase NSUN4 [Condylostylus longicornis]